MVFQQNITIEIFPVLVSSRAPIASLLGQSCWVDLTYCGAGKRMSRGSGNPQQLTLGFLTTPHWNKCNQCEYNSLKRKNTQFKHALHVMTQKRHCNFYSCSTKSLHNSKLPDYLNLIWFYYHPSHSFHVGPHHGGSEIMSGTRLCIANLCGQAAYFCAIFCGSIAYFCGAYISWCRLHMLHISNQMHPAGPQSSNVSHILWVV